MSRLRWFVTIPALAGLLVLLVWWLQPVSYIETFPPPKAGPFPAPEIPEGKLAIDGVVQSPAGAAIPGAWVTATGIKKIASASCDTAGRFHLEGLAAGSFEVTAAAPGYRPASASIKAGEGPITIGLQPLGVFDEGPNPPPAPTDRYKFTCKIEHQGGPSAGFVAALVPVDIKIPAATVKTPIDASGIFQIENLYPGAYTLRILSAARDHDPEFCFASLPVAFGPGKTPPDLVTFRTRSIRGVVLVPPVPDLLPAPPDWAPFEGAVVRILLVTPTGMTEAGYADTDAEGRFEFRILPDGDYRIEALASEFEQYAAVVDKKQGDAIELKIPLIRKRP